MNKEFLKAIIELLVLLNEDEDNAVIGIFSDQTIAKMNEVRDFTTKELIK